MKTRPKGDALCAWQTHNKKVSSKPVVWSRAQRKDEEGTRWGRTRTRSLCCKLGARCESLLNTRRSSNTCLHKVRAPGKRIMCNVQQTRTCFTSFTEIPSHMLRAWRWNPKMGTFAMPSKAGANASQSFRSRHVSSQFRAAVSGPPCERCAPRNSSTDQSGHERARGRIVPPLRRNGCQGLWWISAGEVCEHPNAWRIWAIGKRASPSAWATWAASHQQFGATALLSMPRAQVRRIPSGQSDAQCRQHRCRAEPWSTSFRGAPMSTDWQASNDCRAPNAQRLPAFVSGSETKQQ